MSTTLERLLKTEITTIVNNFESNTSRGADPQVEQDKFINDLSAGIARAVFTYLQTNVTYVAPAIPSAVAPVIVIP
jgi:hypothetical protein